jgi:hypothetical protein
MSPLSTLEITLYKEYSDAYHHDRFPNRHSFNPPPRRKTMTEEITLDAQTITHLKAVSDSGQAFGKAIDEGRLSDDEEAPNYAGNYMFMGYQGGTGKALFKHINTRLYLD